MDWTSTRITDTPSRQDCTCQKERVSRPQCEFTPVSFESPPSAWCCPSAVSVLSHGLSIRVAAEDLGMPYHTLHSWVRDQRRARRKTVVKAPPKTMVDAQARVRELEAEVRKLTLEKDILKKAAAYFAREQS